MDSIDHTIGNELSLQLAQILVPQVGFSDRLGMLDLSKMLPRDCSENKIVQL